MSWFSQYPHFTKLVLQRPTSALKELKHDLKGHAPLESGGGGCAYGWRTSYLWLGKMIGPQGQPLVVRSFIQWLNIIHEAVPSLGPLFLSVHD